MNGVAAGAAAGKVKVVTVALMVRVTTEDVKTMLGSEPTSGKATGRLESKNELD